MLAPVKRSQSPISTASAGPVSVETPGPQEIAADVLASAHQVAGGFLGDARYPHRRDLPDLQQLGH
jgi:hypothetical protein